MPKRIRSLIGARPGTCTGFTLVEVMVALVIGLSAVVIMLSMLIQVNASYRATSGGADAQNIGSVALHTLQLEIKHGGYGLVWPTLLGCNLVLPPPSGVTVPAVPVVINPGSSVVPAHDANTDALVVISGSSDLLPQGNPITAISGTDFTVQLPSSFHIGDYVVAVPGACAAALPVGRVTAISEATVTAATGIGTRMYDLGGAPTIRGYAIRNGNLTTCDFLAADCATDSNWGRVASNLVSLRAEYGVDTTSPMDGIVDTYTQTTPTTACGWQRVLAVRLVLVARNPEYNKTAADGTNVTMSAPAWDGSAPIDLSGNGEWRHYRYRTFQTIVPLRNMIWLGERC